MNYPLKLVLIAILFIFSSALTLKVIAAPAPSQNWYTLMSGNWEDSNIWTLDPSGTLPDNPSNEIPDIDDNVFILSGKTVTINSNNYTIHSINIMGRLFLGTTNGHNFTDINGSGRIYIAGGDNFPAGDATDFATADFGEGTVVYYGSANFNLTNPRTFYNMEISMDNAVNVVTLKNAYSIKGNLTIKKGVLQINDAATLSSLTLDINGDLTVMANSSITVGSANVVHQVYVGGSFYNSGIVRFTNQAVPDYANSTTTGGIVLTFDGANDAVFNCGNTTDLYQLVITKGSNLLSLYADAKNYFALFGPNNGTASSKALWLNTGKLSLAGKIYIPSLTEGTGNFAINQNSQLILNGSDVFLGITADASSVFAGLSHGAPLNINNACTNTQGLDVSGQLTINQGYFYLGAAEAINYNTAYSSKIVINGGTLEANQIAISSTATTDYLFSVNGGTVKVTGAFCPNATKALLHLNNVNMGFSMSGGEIIIQKPTTNATNGIYIGSSAGNCSVTGGKVTIDYNSGGVTDVHINSTSKFYDLEVAANTNVLLQAQLHIGNDLIIRAGGKFTAAGFNLYIGRNFVLKNGAAFVHNNNTTYFDGASDGYVEIENNTNNPALNFYNLSINKDQKSNPALFWDLKVNECLGRSIDPLNANNTIIQINNNLDITRGQFTIDRYTVSLMGNLNITDGKIVYNSGTPGRVKFEGAALQTITGSDKNLGFIEINNANSVVLATNAYMDGLRLTTGILNIGGNKLTLNTNTVDGAPFSVAKMVMTNGTMYDHGLEYTFNLSAATPTGLISTYPIGCGGKYTPAEIYLNNPLGASYTGSFRVVCVNTWNPSLQTQNEATGNPYYWKTYGTGNLSNIAAANISLWFYDPYSVYNAGEKQQYLGTTAWISAGNAISPTIKFAVGFLATQYSVGTIAGFSAVKTFYSRQSGQWTNAATWSNTGYSGAAAVTTPTWKDIVYIKGAGGVNHTVTINANGQLCAMLTVFSGGTLDIGTTVNHGFVEIRGGGRIRKDFSWSIPTGTWDQFIENDTATFEYYNSTASNFMAIATTADGLYAFPNLEISDNVATKYYTQPLANIFVKKNLLINKCIVTLAGGYNFTVNGTLTITNAGKLEFPTGAGVTPCVVSIDKSIDLSKDNTANTVYVWNAGALANPHTLNVGGDILSGTASIIDLFVTTANGKVNLTFTGSGNSVITSNGRTLDLYRLIINKSENNALVDFRENFTLGAVTNGVSSSKALYLIRGDLLISNGTPNITLTSGGGNFVIPAEAKLRVQNATVKATVGAGVSNGIYLDGYMQVGNSSHWLLNQGLGTDIYIEYTGSGYSTIDIQNGELRVGSQIRRNAANNYGILNFEQNNSGSTVVIGEKGAPVGNRGVFEVMNGEFKQVANSNITIVRAQTGASTAAINLYPAYANIGVGATFTVGNASTPAAQTIGISSNIKLKNIIVNSTNSPTLKMLTESLALDENLTINTGATFDANGLPLAIGGNMSVLGTGQFISNANTTTFNGSAAQTITGNIPFYNFTKSTSNTLNLSAGLASLTVNNEFRIDAGTFVDNSNVVTIKGDLYNDGTVIYGGAGSGFKLNGTSPQKIDGTGIGVYGMLTIQNSTGVNVIPGNNITITDGLNLSGGVIDIGSNLLELKKNALVIPGIAFGITNMIKTNISSTDQGVKKTFPAGASNFLLPIGSATKYNPVNFTITANNNNTGAITIKGANEIHPQIIDDTETPPIFDPNYVLKYYWNLKADGIFGFSSIIEMKYDVSDVNVQAPYNISNYITAMFDETSGNWNKFNTADFDEGNGVCRFNFTNVRFDQITGDYTAGIFDAIPNSILFFETNQSGSWNDGSIWTPNIVGGPRGAKVRINAGHTVYMPDNYKSVSSITINGRLEINNTFGHRLGDVDGTGVLFTKQGALPSGYYSAFFSATGGTLEYGGTADFDIFAGITQVNNLILSGKGERRFPNENVNILGSLTINGDDATLNMINEFNKQITIGRDIVFNVGSIDPGTGADAIVEMKGSSVQSITGNFTGSNQFNNITINNPSGVTLNSPVDLKGNLTFKSGVITSSAANNLSITNISSTISGNNSSNYVDGPMRKMMASGSSFEFPVGDGLRYGLVKVISPYTSGSQYWEAEYYNSNPCSNVPSLDTARRGAGLKLISGNEYWRIKGPAGASSNVELNWNSFSILPAKTNDRKNKLNIVEWDNGSNDWKSVGSGPAQVVDNGVNSGSIRTNVAVNLDEHYFTIGTSETAPLPAAGFITTNKNICLGSSTNLSVQLVGKPNWKINVSDGTVTTTYSNITTSPFTFNVSPIVKTTYTIVDVTDNYGTTSTTSIFGNPVEVDISGVPTVFNIGGGGSYCSGGSGVGISLANSEVGIIYKLYRGGVATGTTLNGTGSPLTFGNQINTGNYTIVAEHSANSTCSQAMNGSVNISTIPLPVATLTATAALDTICHGSNTQLTVAATTGSSPFNFTVSNGTSSDVFTNKVLPFTFNPAAAPTYTGPPGWKTTYTYTITITDNNGCTKTNADTEVVKVLKIAETGNLFKR